MGRHPVPALRQPAGYVPPQVHGHTGLEIAWTIAPLIIVLAIAAYSFVELQKDFQPISNQQMTVIVSGHQFGWDYDYENGVMVHQEGSLAAPVPPFVVPTHTLVKLQFQGDRRHPLVVGARDLGQDRRGARLRQLLVAEDRPRRASGAVSAPSSAASGHATMQIIVQAMDQPDYDAWVTKQKAAGFAARPVQ